MNLKLLLALCCVASAGAAQAITVDGNYDPAYGPATATVAYNPAAPDSNFGAPTNESAYVAYSIYLNSSSGFVYAYLQADPSQGGGSAGSFANLYFDTDPANGNGSDIGFELSAGSQTIFIPGGSGPVAATGITVVANGNGIEAAIPIGYFTGAYPGLTYGAGSFATPGSPVTLRLSQSFGYSVAGGPTYGPDRLGTVVLAGAVPEPATWGLMLAGFAAVGMGARRRRSAAVAA